MGPNKDDASDQKALEVGQNFAREYYQAAVTDVDKLMRFFGQDSVIADHRGEHHSEAEKIREALTSLRLDEAGAKILGLNAVTTGNGIMVQVVVEYEFDTLKSTSSECFFLVRQNGKNYYVRSAMFKWVTPHQAPAKKPPTSPVPTVNNVNGQEAKKSSPGATTKSVARPTETTPTTSIATENGAVQNGVVNGETKLPTPVKETKNQSWAARISAPGVKSAPSHPTASGNRQGSEKKSEEKKEFNNQPIVRQISPDNQENKNPAKVSKAAVTLHISGIVIEPTVKTPNERIVSEELNEQLKAFGEIDDIRYPQSFYRPNTRNIYMFVDFTNVDAFDKIAADGTKESEGTAFRELSLASLGFNGRVKFSRTQHRTARISHGKRSPRHNHPSNNRHNNKNRNSNDIDVSKTSKTGPSRDRSNEENNRPRRNKNTWTKTTV